MEDQGAGSESSNAGVVTVCSICTRKMVPVAGKADFVYCRKCDRP